MNRLVLNLRNLSTIQSSSVQSGSDVTFRKGQGSSLYSSFIRRFHLDSGSILGNIGEPLGNNGDEIEVEEPPVPTNSNDLGVIES